MLEMLSRYQFQSPDMYLRALLRCAVLSGASEVSLGRASDGPGPGFELSFDGRPFSKEELSDAYSPLLSGGASRGGHLAAGLLALLRTAPALISIASGGASVRITGILQQKPGPAVSGERTVLRVFWTKDPEDLPLARILDFPLRSDAALACCPVPVRSPGGKSRPFAVRNSPAGPLCFEAGGRRGFISPQEAGGPAPLSRICIHVAGVYVETQAVHMPFAAVSADINDDGLNLDASFGHCVRDERFAELLSFLEMQAGELLLREIKIQKKCLDDVGSQLKSRKIAGLWRARMLYLEDWASAKPRYRAKNLLLRFWKWLNTVEPEYPVKDAGWRPKDFPEKNGGLSLTASRTWWLRSACLAALKNYAASPGDPPLKSALWSAPVLLSTHGVPLSLVDIHRRVREGRMAVSKYVKGEALYSGEAVWLASFRDADFLGEWIPRDRWDGDFL